MALTENDTQVIEPHAEVVTKAQDATADEQMPPATRALLDEEQNKSFHAFVGPEFPLRVQGDTGLAMRLTVVFLGMLATLGAVLLFVYYRYAGT